jgi:uncharacterized protein
MEHTRTEFRPTPEPERILSLDVLRGFAVLGILVMNIQSFSMVGSAYMNPTASGGLSFDGIHRLVWTLSHLLADQKFLSIFSMLFGAGIVLLTSRREAAGLSAASLHYRRSFWLLVIGLAHGIFLWYGDILVTYAICAFLAYLFRKVRPVPLVIVGGLIFLVPFGLFSFFGWSMQFWPPEAAQQSMASWVPSAEKVAAELATYRGPWLGQVLDRLPLVAKNDTFLFVVFQGWRAGGLMLLGMALYKWGVLAARRSRRFYAILAAVGFGVGVPLILAGIARNSAANWSFEYSMFFGSRFNYIGSLGVALGYVAVVMLLSEPPGRFARLLAPVGRMAFTNYLLQTAICTTLFYGHGLGLFGRVERGGQILIVFGVWILQIWLSRAWLRRFRVGPAEWLWRSLSYGAIQPMRRTAHG